MRRSHESKDRQLCIGVVACSCLLLVGYFVELVPPTSSAELPTHTEPFDRALPGYQYVFPRDHGSHDTYRTEWWYYTGHLFSDNGRRFGYQLTFFRRGVAQDPDHPNPSRWTIRHLYLAHFALTDVDHRQFRYAEKVSRAALGKAGAEAGRLRVWIDRWVAERHEADPQAHHLRASTEQFAINLKLTGEKPPVVHGRGGISLKGDQDGQASHYYSLTRLSTEGTVVLQGERVPVRGQSWMDHEFGSSDLGKDLVGWDWFSLQFKDHSELMFYALRRADGRSDPASSGTFIFPDKRVLHLTREDVRVEVVDHWTSEASGARYPSRWRISVPTLNLSTELTPLVAGQELITRKSTHVTYWEGAVTLTGERSGASLSGHGYVELTGYAEPFNQQLK